MKDQTETPLTERKVLRRGLMASLAGLGAAALLKVTGASKAEANNGDPLTIGSLTNAGISLTKLTISQNNDAAFLGINGSDITVGSARVGVIGAAGTTSSDTGAAIGTFGFSFNKGAGAVGVQGTASSGIGVRGQSSASSLPAVLGANYGAGLGVRGVGLSNGLGIKGVSNAGSDETVDGDGTGIGVHGKSGSGPGVKGQSSTGPGVLGVSDNQPGIDGISTNSLGIRGKSTNFVGIVGISTNNHGLYGSSSGPNAYGIVAENTNPNGPGLLVTGNAQIFGALQVFGVKNAVIKMADGTNAAVYCQESPEPYFEDFGRAQLVGGVANVPIEREFAALVAGGDYMVYAHPEGDTNGVYVSQRGPAGFQVRENHGGTSSAPFTYRIVTKRKDVEGKRFARVSTEAAQSVAGVRAVLNSMGTPGSNSPTTPQPGAPAPTQGATASPGLTAVWPNGTPGSVPHP